ncbi:hypothetical protein OSTOST_00196 [Ostertagia ostertagi]
MLPVALMVVLALYNGGKSTAAYNNKCMDARIDNYIAAQSNDRQAVLRQIHAIIITADKTVVAAVEPMMGKEMIVYKGSGLMKYGLAGVKNYMSLHVMPIYGSKPLYAKYQSLLPGAGFQKGCINFTSEQQMPLAIVQQLMAECAKIDLFKMKEDYQKAKRSKNKHKC